MRRTSTFSKCRVQSQAAASLHPQTGLSRLDGLAQLNGKAKNGEELGHEVADNLPDNVPVTQQEMEVIETYLAALVEDCWD
jgi:hypothetical protein